MVYLTDTSLYFNIYLTECPHSLVPLEYVQRHPRPIICLDPYHLLRRRVSLQNFRHDRPNV